jgi:hypothetical protein
LGRRIGGRFIDGGTITSDHIDVKLIVVVRGASSGGVVLGNTFDFFLRAAHFKVVSPLALMASFAICRAFSALVGATTEFAFVDHIIWVLGSLIRTSW